MNNKVFFDTLGCAKNQVDTSKMVDLLNRNGFVVVDEAKDAGFIILNTCAFIELATQESIDTFFEYKNYYKDKKIVVCGCLVSRYKDELKKSMPEADAFVACKDEDDICNVLESLGAEASSVKKISEAASSVAFEYVKISDGCNRRCSYCTIPYIRGKYKSESVDVIKEDVSAAVSKGAKEIVLVAQDCGVWGSDVGSNLANLLNELCPKFCDIKFRLLYVYPETINDALIDCFKRHSNLVRYIDMPIQHCNDTLLKSMGRNTNKSSIMTTVKKLKNAVPDIILRTTVMSGYPGETDDSHEELCEFLNDMAFDYVGCFEYSAEEGTRAAKMDGQVSKADKYSRANEIREICDEISLAKAEDKVGHVFDVLIEGEEEGQFFGRAYFQAPDVDGLILIGEHSEHKNVKPGSFVRVKIVEAQGYDLLGVVQDEK